MEIRCHCFWKINELDTFGPRKNNLRKKMEGCTCARKRPVVFWTFHVFPCIFSRELFLVAVHNWFVIQTNVWKCQNATRCFLVQLHSSVIFCKILCCCIVPEVSNSWIFQKRCFMKTSDFHAYKHCYFKTCLPTHQEWLPKPWKGLLKTQHMVKRKRKHGRLNADLV